MTLSRPTIQNIFLEALLAPLIYCSGLIESNLHAYSNILRGSDIHGSSTRDPIRNGRPGVGYNIITGGLAGRVSVLFHYRGFPCRALLLLTGEQFLSTTPSLRAPLCALESATKNRTSTEFVWLFRLTRIQIDAARIRPQKATAASASNYATSRISTKSDKTRRPIRNTVIPYTARLVCTRSTEIPTYRGTSSDVCSVCILITVIWGAEYGQKVGQANVRAHGAAFSKDYVAEWQNPWTSIRLRRHFLSAPSASHADNILSNKCATLRAAKMGKAKGEKNGCRPAAVGATDERPLVFPAGERKGGREESLLAAERQRPQ